MDRETYHEIFFDYFHYVHTTSPTLLLLQPLVSKGLNLVCYLSWMILGSCYVGTKFLNSTTFPNSGIMSDPGLDACLGLDHMLI